MFSMNIFGVIFFNTSGLVSMGFIDVVLWIPPPPRGIPRQRLPPAERWRLASPLPERQAFKKSFHKWPQNHCGVENEIWWSALKLITEIKNLDPDKSFRCLINLWSYQSGHQSGKNLMYPVQTAVATCLLQPHSSLGPTTMRNHIFSGDLYVGPPELMR